MRWDGQDETLILKPRCQNKTESELSSSQLSVCCLWLCRGGGKSWHGSNSSHRRCFGPWCFLDWCEKIPSFLRTAHLPATHAVCWYHRWGNNARTRAYLKKKQICKLIPHVSSSGTFKIQKTRLQREGYKPQESSEKIYYLNNHAGCYKAVTEELYKDIIDGKTSLWDKKIHVRKDCTAYFC